MYRFQGKQWAAMTGMVVCLLIFTAAAAAACTGIQLRAGDGTVVRGRTMEWGSFDMQTRVAIIPRGTAFSSPTPDGRQGLAWKAKHGFAGMEVLGKAVSDGMNEKGLSGGIFYHHGFAEYAEYDADRTAKYLSPDDVLNYILSSFATLEEVREGLSRVTVVPVVDSDLGIPAPIHMMLSAPGGKSMVVEFKNGEPVFFDNPVGVITNNPTFDWHLTNLRNYGFLSPQPFPNTKWGDLKISPLAGGSGFIGLPGDFTAPSRFVRAAVFTQFARDTKNGPDAVLESFRILDNFNVPSAQSEGSDQSTAASLPSATQWTVVMDTGNLAMYYHTMFNRRVRKIDLKRIDFTKGAKRGIPVDKSRAQDIEDLTGELH